MGHATALKQRLEAEGAQEGGKKRKDSGEDNPKCQLNDGIMTLIERSMNKGEMTYEFEEVDSELGRSYVCTLTITCFEDSFVFEGDPASSKKQAEQNACSKALEQFQEEIDAKAPEYRAQKAAKISARKTEMVQQAVEKGAPDHIIQALQARADEAAEAAEIARSKVP